MNLGSYNYQKSIERMQKSIERLDNELERSRQLLSHDITIDNRTQQDLNFVIKVHEEDQINTLNNSESRVHIPHQSTYRHRISTTPRDRQNSEHISYDHVPREKPYFKRIQTPQFDSSKYEYQTTTPKEHTSSIKMERKFQPFSRINNYHSVNIEEFNSQNRRHLTESGIQTDQFLNHQIKIPESKTSDRIGNEGSINYLPSYSQRQNNASNKLLEHTDPINLPVLLSETKKDQKKIGNYPYITQSPQVLNYLKQDYTQHHPQLYTPLNKTEDASFSSIPREKKTSDRKEQKDWRVEPLSVGYQNNKKYFEQVKEKEMVSKILKKADQRKSKLQGPSSSSKQRWKGTSAYPKSNEKYQYLGQFQLSSSRKEKANDLFLQRKSLFMKNLQKNQEQEKRTHQKPHHDRSRSNSNNNLTTTYKKKTRQNSKEMSDKVKDISERLFSRSKEKLHPCNYHQRYGESIERERFDYIVNQNSFVQKYLKKQEQEELFQALRRDDESVSSWPMKILNYTYSKLQKINSSRYTIKKAID